MFILMFHFTFSVGLAFDSIFFSTGPKMRHSFILFHAITEVKNI